MRSLSDDNALGRTVSLNAVVMFPDDFSARVPVCVFFFCHIHLMFQLLSLPELPSFSSASLVSVTFSLNFHFLGCPLSSAAVQEPKEVMFMVELWSGVSRICPFNLAARPRERKSFIWSQVEQFTLSAFSLIKKKKPDFSITFSNGSTNSAY